MVSVLVFQQLVTAQPAFQYQSGEIEVSIPTSTEPCVSEFDAKSLRAAAKYLEDGALSWVREKSCVNCHTTGPYMADRTAWIKYFGKPSDEVLQNFQQAVPGKVKPIAEVEKDGHKHYPGTFTTVWRSLGLAEWDRHVNEKTTEVTDRSLRDMFEHQSANGAFVSHGEVEIPHITTDFELTLQAARAVTAAPNWLSELRDADLLERVSRMKKWLQTVEPENDFDRVLRLQLISYFPETVSDAQRDQALELLRSKQHADGGWSTRDMSDLERWHFEISDTVRELVTKLPDAEQPESDAYMTALAIVLMRQGGVPATDDRIQTGLAWLKKNQRTSGRWWMHSLYRGNYHYITYIATIEAIKAFELCGELDELL